MQWKLANDQYVIRLDGQESVIDQLKAFSHKVNIGSASIQGIGGIESIDYGIFDNEKGAYSRHHYEGFAELISLSGNITWADKEPFVHCHFLAMGNYNNLVGGHLFAAKASITIELFLTFSELKIDRKYDERANFKVMQLPNEM